jgi:hypothetical protein
MGKTNAFPDAKVPKRSQTKEGGKRPVIQMMTVTPTNYGRKQRSSTNKRNSIFHQSEVPADINPIEKARADFRRLIKTPLNIEPFPDPDEYSYR